MIDIESENPTIWKHSTFQTIGSFNFTFMIDLISFSNPYYFNFYNEFLVKPIKLLRNLIAGDRHLPSAFSRQVYALSEEAPAQAHIQREILLFQILPQFFFLLQILLCLRANRQN